MSAGTLANAQASPGGVTGSLVFVFHLAVGLGAWARSGERSSAGIAKAISQTCRAQRCRCKLLFNVAERIVSVGLTFTVYCLLGGQHPPTFLLPRDAQQARHVRGSASTDRRVPRGCARLLRRQLRSWSVLSSRWRTGARFCRRGERIRCGFSDTTSRASLLALGCRLGFRTYERGDRSCSGLASLALCLPLLGFRHIYGKLNDAEGPVRGTG